MDAGPAPCLHGQDNCSFQSTWKKERNHWSMVHNMQVSHIVIFATVTRPPVEQNFRQNTGNDTKNLRKAFLTSANSTCRQHIHQHYQYYSERCKEEGIPESEHCVPCTILEARKKKAKSEKVMVQSKLDGVS